MAESSQDITRKHLRPCEAYTKLNLRYIKYRSSGNKIRLHSIQVNGNDNDSSREIEGLQYDTQKKNIA